MQDCLLHKHLALPSYADMASLVIRYASLCSAIIPTPLAFYSLTCCQKIFATVYAGRRRTHSNKKLLNCCFVDHSPLFSHPATLLHLHRKRFLDFRFFIFTGLISFSSFTFFLFKDAITEEQGRYSAWCDKYLPLFPYMWIHNAVSNRY